MRAFLSYCVAASIVGVAGCQQTVEPPPLRSLERSGKVSFLCRDMESGEGRDLRACPDFDEAVTDDNEDRHTLALITQTMRGEVAVVDAHEGEVIDEDTGIPGREFLPVGANPTSIVSTPGGVATFVGVAEAGREAIFALPTTCITAPKAEQPTRDISLWSACRLPSAPGEMVIAVDPTKIGGTEEFRKTCAPESATEWYAAAKLSKDQSRKKCSANLEAEELIQPEGRRKLVVTLPAQGLVAIYDAQTILNLPPGSFENCVPDRVVRLATTLGTEEVVPDKLPDLEMPAGCNLTQPRYTAIEYDSTNNLSLPAGMALSGSDLYVADLNVPVIHNLDLTDPCEAKEVAPLRPVSFDSPKDAVYAEHLAVSGLVPSGEGDRYVRYLYATVHKEGSAIAFDISPGIQKRVPIVRERADFFPNEAPDRIQFASPIAAISLVTHDVPAVRSASETTDFGVHCDPNPDAKQPRSLYQPNSDYTAGAAPRKLRGLFAMLALDSGQIAAIDIEDWDAPCRRPVTNNPDLGPDETDWLGCKGYDDHNPKTPPLKRFEKDGAATVTDEVSCNVVAPHRPRSGKFLHTDEDHGANSPNLARMPVLASKGTTRTAATSIADRDRQAPKMLAVPFEGCTGKTCSTPQYLMVGTTKYGVYSDGQYELPVDPASAEENSLLLPLREPRVYDAVEQFSATFEGLVVPQRANGILPKIEPDTVVPGIARPLKSDEMLLRDADALFCDNGVEDVDISRSVGQELNLTDPIALDTFARRHGDFVVLKSDFSESDPYFTDKSVAKTCGGGQDLRRTCEDWFGTAKEPTISRELLIREAYHNQLLVTPREFGAGSPKPEALKQAMERIHCCFPGQISYEIRAAQQWVMRGTRLQSNIVPGPDLRCVRACDPRRGRLQNRIFEISSDPTNSDCAATDDTVARPNCFVGSASSASDEVCILPQNTWRVSPEELGKSVATRCVLDSLKARFAIYRGLSPSVRDMSFSWIVNGGFGLLSASMSSVNAGLSVMPTDMQYVKSWDALGVVDGQSGGFRWFGLAQFTPLDEPVQ